MPKEIIEVRTAARGGQEAVYVGAVRQSSAAAVGGGTKPASVGEGGGAPRLKLDMNLGGEKGNRTSGGESGVHEGGGGRERVERGNLVCLKMGRHTRIVNGRNVAFDAFICGVKGLPVYLYVYSNNEYGWLVSSTYIVDFYSRLKRELAGKAAEGDKGAAKRLKELLDVFIVPALSADTEKLKSTLMRLRERFDYDPLLVDNTEFVRGGVNEATRLMEALVNGEISFCDAIRRLEDMRRHGGGGLGFTYNLDYLLETCRVLGRKGVKLYAGRNNYPLVKDLIDELLVLAAAKNREQATVTNKTTPSRVGGGLKDVSGKEGSGASGGGGSIARQTGTRSVNCSALAPRCKTPGGQYKPLALRPGESILCGDNTAVTLAYTDGHVFRIETLALKNGYNLVYTLEEYEVLKCKDMDGYYTVDNTRIIKRREKSLCTYGSNEFIDIVKRAMEKALRSKKDFRDVVGFIYDAEEVTRTIYAIIMGHLHGDIHDPESIDEWIAKSYAKVYGKCAANEVYHFCYYPGKSLLPRLYRMMLDGEITANSISDVDLTAHEYFYIKEADDSVINAIMEAVKRNETSVSLPPGSYVRIASAQLAYPASLWVRLASYRFAKKPRDAIVEAVASRAAEKGVDKDAARKAAAKALELALNGGDICSVVRTEEDKRVYEVVLDIMGYYEPLEAAFSENDTLVLDMNDMRGCRYIGCGFVKCGSKIYFSTVHFHYRFKDKILYTIKNTPIKLLDRLILIGPVSRAKAIIDGFVKRLRHRVESLRSRLQQCRVSEGSRSRSGRGQSGQQRRGGSRPVPPQPPRPPVIVPRGGSGGRESRSSRPPIIVPVPGRSTSAQWPRIIVPRVPAERGESSSKSPVIIKPVGAVAGGSEHERKEGGATIIPVSAPQGGSGASRARSESRLRARSRESAARYAAGTTLIPLEQGMARRSPSGWLMRGPRFGVLPHMG